MFVVQFFEDIPEPFMSRGKWRGFPEEQNQMNATGFIVRHLKMASMLPVKIIQQYGEPFQEKCQGIVVVVEVDQEVVGIFGPKDSINVLAQQMIDNVLLRNPPGIGPPTPLIYELVPLPGAVRIDNPFPLCPPDISLPVSPLDENAEEFMAGDIEDGFLDGPCLSDVEEIVFPDDFFLGVDGLEFPLSDHRNRRPRLFAL